MIGDSDNHDKDFDDFKADLESGWNACMVIYEGFEIFYRTQVNLGSDLWVRMSLRHKLRHLVET